MKVFTNKRRASDQDSEGVLCRRLTFAWDHPSELNGRWSSLWPGRKSTNTIAAKTQGALHLLIIHLQADEAALIWPLLFLHSLAPDDEAELQAGESPQIFGLEATRAER